MTDKDPETSDLVQFLQTTGRYTPERFAEPPFPFDFFWSRLADALQAFMGGLMDTDQVPDVTGEAWLLAETAHQLEHDLPPERLRAFARVTGEHARGMNGKTGHS